MEDFGVNRSFLSANDRFLNREKDGIRSPRKQGRILVRSDRSLLIVDLSQVLWIEAKEKSSLWHCISADYFIRMGIQSLEGELHPEQFVRIHRSYIVNVDAIREVRSSSDRGYQVVLQDGTKLPWSRHYRDRLTSVERLISLIPPKKK